MSSSITGNYTLRMKFGGTDVPLNPTAMDEFTIIHDMNSFLPYFRLRLMDTTGLFTHVAPFDKGISRVSVEVGGGAVPTSLSQYEFIAYRRFPESLFSVSNYYDIGGLLNIPNLFNPCISRAALDSVGNFAQSMALKELGCKSVSISQDLFTSQVKILQAKWSNAQLLRYWKRSLGDSTGYCYMPFITLAQGNTVFVFKSLNDMAAQTVSYKFIIADTPTSDYLPVTDYTIIDNYKVSGLKGVQTQEYMYFNYKTGKFIDTKDNYSNYVSMSDYIAADRDDSVESMSIQNLGRTNEFTETFKGRVRAKYYRRLNDLTKMWIYTWGLTDVVPGMVVKVLFAQSAAGGNIASYQYSGYWLVERVVHSFGSSFSTKLLLTRAGVDTDKSTTLVPATIAKA